MKKFNVKYLESPKLRTNATYLTYSVSFRYGILLITQRITQLFMEVNCIKNQQKKFKSFHIENPF